MELTVRKNLLNIEKALNFFLKGLSAIPGTKKYGVGISTEGMEASVAETEKAIAAIKNARDKATQDAKDAANKEREDAESAKKKEAESIKNLRDQAEKDKADAEKSASDKAFAKAEAKADKEKKILLKEKEEELEIRRKAIAAELLMSYTTGEQEAAFSQYQADKYREINARLIEDTRLLAEEDFLRTQELEKLSLEEKILRVEKELQVEEMSAQRRDELGKKLYDLEIQRMTALDAKKKIQQTMFLDAFAKMGEGQLSLQEAVSQGMLDFYKKEALAAVDIEAGKMFQMGMARLIASLFTDPTGYAHLAGSAALVAGSRAAIGSIKLAEGGIVMPQPGGVSATVAEAGRPEIVMPLDDPRASGLMGGSGGREVIILSSDGQTMLAKGIYAEQQELLRTGQIGRSRI